MRTDAVLDAEPWAHDDSHQDQHHHRQIQQHNHPRVPTKGRHGFAAYASPESDGQHPSMLSENEGTGRYVAGEQFYNYEMYGSLRKGGAVQFYSMECLGLIAATFTSAFSYLAMVAVTRPMMSSQLNLTKQENTAVQRLTDLPMALSIFVGLLSDCYPIMGLRRKGYMIVGLVMNAVSVLALAGLSAHFEHQAAEDRNGALIVLAIIMITLASFGCIITYMCVHTRVIELSQRESLRDRGAIQADYLIFRRFVSVGANTFSYLTMGTGPKPNVNLSIAMVMLTVICVLPTPLILKYWEEEYYSLPSTVKVRAQIFWKIMQQKAVWRVLMFITLFGFFLPIRFNDSANVIRDWSGSKNDNTLIIKTIQDVVMLTTIFVWKKLFINSLWRSFFAWAPVFLIVPQLLVSAFAAYDVVRDRYFYRTMIAVSNISDGITFLNNVVPLVEIIQEGSEGATVGLSISLQRLVGIFVSTNAQGLFRGSNFYDVDAVQQDSGGIRTDVFLSLLVNFGINLVGVVALVFLPSQKLDAQQLRMYGGFTKAASSVIVVISLALFVYSLVINIMTFIPSLQCAELVGGDGC